MTGTTFIDLMGAGVVMLCVALFAPLFVVIVGTPLYGLWRALTESRTPDHRDYGSSDDWPD